MTLWDNLKDRYGTNPHPLAELVVEIEECSCRFQFVTSKASIMKRTVRSPVRGGGEVEVTGELRGEDEIIIHPGSYFMLGETVKTIYIGMDAETVGDFITARETYRLEKDRLRENWDRARRTAEAEMPKIMAEIEKHMDSLNSHIFDGRGEPYLRDVKYAMIDQKLTALHRKNSEHRTALASKKPPMPDRSYQIAVQFSGVEMVSIQDITKAVFTAKTRLMGELGILPKKTTWIPLRSVLNMAVSWR